MKFWCVYMIKSFKDGSIYTGISTDYKRRIEIHNKGKGAKYTRGRGPWYLMTSLEASTKSEALKKEAKIKKLSKEQKIRFCNDHLCIPPNLNKIMKDPCWCATNFGPDVVSVYMNEKSYQNVQKYGCDVVDMILDVNTLKTGLVAHIFGIEIRLAYMPTNLTHVTYKNGVVKTLCDFHGWSNGRNCDHIDCVVEEIHES